MAKIHSALRAGARRSGLREEGFLNQNGRARATQVSELEQRFNTFLTAVVQIFAQDDLWEHLRCFTAFGSVFCPCSPCQLLIQQGRCCWPTLDGSCEGY